MARRVTGIQADHLQCMFRLIVGMNSWFSSFLFPDSPLITVTMTADSRTVDVYPFKRTNPNMQLPENKESAEVAEFI